MRRNMKRAMAVALSLAMVFSMGGVSQTASAAKKIKVSIKNVVLKVGASKKVTVKNAPKKAKITWTSKKKAVAKVNKVGKITGVSKGKTKVICKVIFKKNGKKKTQKFTINVQVKKASAPKETVAVTTVPSAAPTSGASVSQSDAPGTSVAPETSAAPEVTASAEPTPLLVKSDDTSNIGEERIVTIVGGTTSTAAIKDNGSMRPELSSQYLIANEMGQGINLGNTMEATKALGEKDSFTEATDFEQAWGAPITTQEYIDAVHSYGFNTIRIPVAWSSMVSKDGNYTIDEKLLGRVEEIVNYALNNGMYVIVNDHWDYGWWGQFGAAKLDADGKPVPDEEVRAEAWARYESYWTQICERFKDYSDHLILESANEELGPGLNDPLDVNGYKDESGIRGCLNEKEIYEMSNAINQKFVDIVRKSGGNNATRHLLIAGINTNIEKTCDDRFIMPTDTEENGNTKLSVSVHYYDPWSYCGDGASGASYTEKDKENHMEQFDMMKKFTDAGYGVIVGEYGVCNPRQDQVTEWLYDAMCAMVERGCLPVLWDTPGTYFDRTECKMTYKDVAELYNSVTGANGETESITATTGKPNAKIEPIDLTGEETLVWQWEGLWKKNDGSNTGLDGNKVSATDITKFVLTDNCTDESMITFNDWGYQTFMNLDWASIKKPCIKVTFEEDTEDAVGNIQFGTVAKVNGACTDLQAYEYAEWSGKSICLSDAVCAGLESKDYLHLTFGNAPLVTGIYVYDLGE